MLIEILISFILKACDNALSTFKTIYLSKGKYLIGSLFNGASCFFYTIAVVRIAKSNNLYSVLAMCLATFIGTFLPGIFMKRSERDKLYIFEITADTLLNGKKFADIVRNHNIAVKTYKSYDGEMNKVLSCKVYCSSKEESKIVNGLIPNAFKYNVYVPITE